MPPKKKAPAKRKAKKPSTKGTASKTRKGDKNYTTKSGDKDFHRGGHNIQPAIIRPYETLQG